MELNQGKSMIFEYLFPTVMAAVMTFITAGINQWKSMIFEYLFPTVMPAVMTFITVGKKVHILGNFTKKSSKTSVNPLLNPYLLAPTNLGTYP